MEYQAVYMSIRMIQNFLNEYHENTGNYCSFSRALESLYHSGTFYTKSLKKPDYKKWDTSHPEDLWDIYADTEINVLPILRAPNTFESFVSEEYIGFQVRDIIMNMSVHNEDIVKHKHNYFEINYVLKGTLHTSINGECQELSVGDFCIIAPGSDHSICADIDTLSVIIALRKSTFQTAFSNILLGESLLSDFFQKCLYSPSQNYLLFRIPPTPKICNILKDLFEETTSDQRNSNEISCNYLSILLGLALRNYGSMYVAQWNKRSVSTHMFTILTYIKNNYRTLSLGALADFFGYDPDYLGKQIFAATGKHYSDIVLSLKIEEAIKWLKFTDYQIGEISDFVGYNSPQHFSRAFHHKIGMTPSQYRKELLAPKNDG